MSFSDRQHVGLVVPFLIGISSAYAQTTPDAGALRQQIEGQMPKALPGEKKPLTALPPEYKPASGLEVTVKQFRFADNTLLTAEQLAPNLASFLNRPLDFAGLQQAMAAVSEAYRAAGWLVRVYLPRQDITDGVVTLQIVEGIFGKVHISDPLPLRFSTELAKAHVAAAQPAGQALNAAALDRALLLLDDLPGVAVSGNLAPGSGEAETDLVLKMADEPLFNGEGGIDNTGSRSTGEQRLSVNAVVASPLKIGDQLAANIIHSEGSDYARLAYSLPVGYDGLRLGVNASRLDYKVITPEFKAANILGDSTSIGLDIQYPLIRSRNRNLYLSTAYDDKAFDNKANGATSTHYGVRNLSVGLNGNLFDALGSGGANMASLNLTAGAVDLSDSPNKATDATTTQTHGDFTKLRYALSRQQAISSELSLYALFTGQLASKNLDSSEKFFLGGANGVRAFPSNEGGGSEGSMLNLELRWRVASNWLVTGFYDWGSVTINKNNSFAGSPSLNSFNLDGLGASLAWTGPRGLTVKGTYAQRTGNNANRDATSGNDQDGSYKNPRIWLVASIPFTLGGGKASSGRTGSAVEVKATDTTKNGAVPITTVAASIAPAPAPEAAPEPARVMAATKNRPNGPMVSSDISRKSAEISPSAKAMLDEVANYAAQNPGVGIEVSGHTDRTSVSKYLFNLQLSEQRALDAKNYLIAKGVPANRIKAIGLSYTKPVASNETQDGRDQNRRIEVRLID